MCKVNELQSMPNSMDIIRKKFKTKQEYDDFLEAVSLNC